ncbi:M23 family metallopeptidase [Bacillus norwichensis]|uniref:M23 family metallopeptidase n=1 Tax=Bacillus norwichensis TaxID=2762217 RepID=A0ABR8VJ41_9BACI|nr:M23 family metallopeptidase [Bacillus norwichensis]MBD8004778.1 M23 family metallopeptidase [Bacillus norwichensis]
MVFEGYRVSSSYGWRIDPVGGGREFHSGVDLVKADRAPILAFADGTVLFSGIGRIGTGLGGYGKVVVIKDLNGCAHLYAHLSKTKAIIGTFVKKNQIIGYQGATGKVTGSHLHYEIRKKSSPSYGWTVNREQSTLAPIQYLQTYHQNRSRGLQKLILPKTSSSWRIYPTNKRPVKGNEVGFLNPKKFGGLEYEIIGNPQNDVYTIQTAHFGKVNIYAASGTGAKIN